MAKCEPSLQSRDEGFMREALRMAKRAEALGEVPIGAVIVEEGRIIARGWNRRESLQDVTEHAEMHALRKACKRLGSWRLPNCTLYVTLEPCPMCAAALQQARLKRLVFGASDPKAGAIVSCDCALDKPYLNHQVQYQGGVLAEETSHYLKTFFRNLREERRKNRHQSSTTDPHNGGRQKDASQTG